MSAAPKGEVTRLLHEAQAGGAGALDRLLPLVYEEIHRLAERYMGGQNPEHTLQPTALVHETYLKLVRLEDPSWESRRHFFAVAARAMRSILVDHARSKNRVKRRGKMKRAALDGLTEAFEERAVNLVALDEALRRLAQTDERMAQVVELRFFGGMNAQEVAEVLGVSVRTVERDWSIARLWLREQVAGE